jgi:hypothetical protein
VLSTPGKAGRNDLRAGDLFGPTSFCQWRDLRRTRQFVRRFNETSGQSLPIDWASLRGDAPAIAKAVARSQRGAIDPRIATGTDPQTNGAQWYLAATDLARAANARTSQSRP